MKLKKIFMATILSSLIAGQTVSVYGSVLHQIEKKQVITSGLEHTYKQVLTSTGWQDLNILKIDLSNDNIAVKPIEPTTLGGRQNILSLAQENGAIAAVNSDFFDMSSKTPYFGPTFEDGQISQAYHTEHSSLGPKKYMGTFVIDDYDTAAMNYYGVQMSLESEGKKVCDVISYNKLPSSIRIPFIVDQKFYPDNMSLVNKYRDTGIYTAIVENDEITYISELNEVVSIPKEGYAVILSTYAMNTYGNSFYEGAPLSFNQNLTLNNAIVESIDQLKTGIGGGGLILQNGVAYSGNSHQVSGGSREPRTVVATTYNPNEVLLVTIDGRLTNTLGASHNDLVQILRDLGAKDAMYFDGGGSTTMVARNEGSQSVSLQNKPSGGTQRNVANGLGIFSTAGQSELASISLTASRDRTFVDEPIKFTLSAFDTNHNPLTLSENDISVSVAGITGRWEGLNFYPESTGTGLVMATVDGITATTEIKVTKAAGVVVEPASLQLGENTTKQVQLYGMDQEGYKIPINPNKVVWTNEKGTVTAAGNTVASKGKAVETLTAHYQNAEGKLSVIVGDSVVALESFEENGAKWAGDTATVSGKVEFSKDVKYHGNQALKMTYNFQKDTNKQVAYTVFNKPIELPSDTKSINLWVYANGQGDALKLQVQDSAGKQHYLKLSDSLNHKGWKYLTVNVPEEVQFPAKATKLYAYSTSNPAKRTSSLYIDHVSITRGDRTGVATGRMDNLFDSSYKASLQAPTGSQYSVKVTGPTLLTSVPVSQETVGSMAKTLSENASFIVQAAANNLGFNLQVPSATYNNQFQTVDHKDMKMIFMGTDKGGLRQTDGNQWNLLKQALESSTAKFEVIVMSKNPLTQFEDSREGKALHDYLVEYKKKTGKPVFVVTTGSTSKEVRLEDGIRYIRLSGLASPDDQLTGAEYLSFKIVGNQIYYTFEPMLKNKKPTGK